MMQNSVRPILALLTDFGLSDGYVGVMKGVILGIAPESQLIDLSHQVPPQQIVSAAWILATSYRYFPSGTIFVCVVDPGVGSARLPLALRAGSWYFVGPNNGIFSSVMQQETVYEAVSLTNAAYHLPQVSATFQGRDLFAPVAAHLACGVALQALGTPVESTQLQRLDLEPIVQENGHLHGYIIHVDHFGNLITNIAAALLSDLLMKNTGLLIFPQQGYRISQRHRFFAEGLNHDHEQPFLYIDSSGYLAVAISNGNAAAVLGAGYRTAVSFLREGTESAPE